MDHLSHLRLGNRDRAEESDILDPAEARSYLTGMLNVLIAMGFGILGSVVIQVSKGMQRQGIEIIKRNIEIRKNVAGGDEKPRKPLIYLLGVMLANTNALWIILAARYAPSTYFTSMYGVGLIALILYCRFVLHEEMTRRQMYGIALLVAGTIILGVDGMLRDPSDMSAMNRRLTYIWSVVFFIVIGGLLLVTLRGKRSNRLGLFFGILSGGSASLDPIYKGIGQSFGGELGFIPSAAAGWIPYILSFLFGIAAFLVIQWGFAKGARASTLGAAHSAVYVVQPILLQAAFLPSYSVNVTVAIGLIGAVAGIVLVQDRVVPRPKPVAHPPS